MQGGVPCRQWGTVRTNKGVGWATACRALGFLCGTALGGVGEVGDGPPKRSGAG